MDTPSGTPRQTIIWRVPAMHNQQDAAAIRRLVDSLHGVALLAMEPVARLITVEYDPDSATLAEIAAFLATAGYPVERPS